MPGSKTNKVVSSEKLTKAKNSSRLHKVKGIKSKTSLFGRRTVSVRSLESKTNTTWEELYQEEEVEEELYKDSRDFEEALTYKPVRKKVSFAAVFQTAINKEGEICSQEVQIQCDPSVDEKSSCCSDIANTDLSPLGVERKYSEEIILPLVDDNCNNNNLLLGDDMDLDENANAQIDAAAIVGELDDLNANEDESDRSLWTSPSSCDTSTNSSSSSDKRWFHRWIKKQRKVKKPCSQTGQVLIRIQQLEKGSKEKKSDKTDDKDHWISCAPICKMIDSFLDCLLCQRD